VVTAARPKRRVLAVVPYGMALRNLVLNEALWSYLTGTYEVDLATPFEIPDASQLGVANVLHDPRRRSVAGIVDRVRRRAVGALMELDRMAFFRRANEAETFQAIYRYAVIDGRAGRLLFWSWLGHSPLARPVRWLARAIGTIGLGAADVRRYDFVLLTHPAELRCMAYGLAANAHGVPVVCMPMGMDNLMHGPLVFVPDLLLAWGQEQARDLTLQQRFDPRLADTECVVVGSPTHDLYVRCDTAPDLDRIYSLAATDQVILFPAFIEKYGPSQLAFCALILDFIRRSGRPLKLLVRARPGIDETLWRDFQARHPVEVRLQLPTAASYDKSGLVSGFDPAGERTEVALFAATLRRAAVVVASWFTTVETDALLFGTPTIDAMFDPVRPSEPHPILAWYVAGLAKMPEWGAMRVVTTPERLASVLEEVLDRRGEDNDAAARLFRYRATAPDGRAGERAVAALRDFVARPRERRV
jgi:hypothetical protein